MMLLVEDEAVARMNFAHNLRTYGYEVLEAADGAEATIGMLETHDGAIKL